LLELTEKLDTAARFDAVISLDYDSRKRGRFKTLTETDEEAGIFLDRGQTLMDGDYLRATDGRVVLVKAAAEPLTEASTTDPVLFAKICYHLGNRHTPVDIQTGAVRFQPDHVLSDLCRQWGLQVVDIAASFNPERGAYGQHAGGSHHHD
jgi:urease accessory protein